MDGRMETRSIDLRGMGFRALEPEADRPEQIVEGYASKFGVVYTLFEDRNYKVLEQIDPHAFDGCDLSDVIFQYNHEGRVFARVSNGTLTVTPDNIGLKIRANLGGTEAGRQLYEEIRDGYTTKMSFRFFVGEHRRETTEDEEHNTTTILRTITKIRQVLDVSAVSIPASGDTEISAASQGSAAELCRVLIADVERETERHREMDLRARSAAARLRLLIMPAT